MRAELVERTIDPAALLREVASISDGAAVVFVGTVRETNNGRPVTALDYRAYAAMAEAELSAIALEAEARWTPAKIVCEHRTGALALGDVSVAIVAAHPHRTAAFDACRYVIEELKQRVPIWKREHYADGELEWVENRATSRSVPSPSVDR